MQIVKAILLEPLLVVFQIGPITKNGTEIVVARQFGIQSIVNLQTGLPLPTPLRTARSRLLGTLHRPRQLLHRGESARVFSRIGIPVHTHTHFLLILPFGSRRLLSIGLALSSHAILGTGQITNYAIARAVDKQPSLEKKFLAALQMLARYRRDLPIARSRFIGMNVLINRYARLFKQLFTDLGLLFTTILIVVLVLFWLGEVTPLDHRDMLFSLLHQGRDRTHIVAQIGYRVITANVTGLVFTYKISFRIILLSHLCIENLAGDIA